MDQNTQPQIPVLPEDVPVIMPDLPAQKVINTLEQFKAISDSTRSRILNVVQLRPATAKQIADRLGASPGAIGHHLRVLEEAGLVQVSARRLVRGIVASYYTRTARLFLWEIPKELAGDDRFRSDIYRVATTELAESRRLLADPVQAEGFPHARLSPERLEYYTQRLKALLEELIAEPAEGPGDIYGLFFAMFKSPPYLQNDPSGEMGGEEKKGES